MLNYLMIHQSVYIQYFGQQPYKLIGPFVTVCMYVTIYTYCYASSHRAQLRKVALAN